MAEPSLLDAALSYAARGWRVLPLHEIRDGNCTCGSATCGKSAGKHPRIKTGKEHEAASTDEATIRAWWARWPSANVGIVTGPLSDLVVLDVDGDDGLANLALLQEQIGPMPPAVCSQTGSGGYHYLFRHPGKDHRVVNRAHALAPCLDIRGNGGLFVLPPSRHYSGNEYHWVVAPDAVPIAEFAWLGKALEWAESQRVVRQTTIVGAPVAPQDRTSLLRRASAYLAKLPESISGNGGHAALWTATLSLSRGFGLASSDVLGLLAGEFNPRCKPPWSRRELKHKIEDVEDESTTPVGYLLTVDALLEHGSEVAAVLIETSRQQAIARQLALMPSAAPLAVPELLPKSGLIRDMVEYVLASSIRPQPELAIAAVVAFVGALAGRKYKTETDLRTNLYLVGIADSGAGKDHARKCIQRVAHLSNTTGFLGGERLPSGAGLITALKRNPSQLFMLDEFGFLLAAMTSKAADANKRDLMATLMGLYTSASVVYRGAEYADQEKRSRTELVQPNCCVYGTSTPAQFYAALTSMQGIDGSLARLMVVHASDHRPPRRRPSVESPPPALIDAVRSLAAQKAPPLGNLASLGGTAVDTDEPLLVKMDPGIWEAWEQLDDLALDHAEDSAGRTVYSRVAENAARLALVHAVSRNFAYPTIDAEAFAWGRELALWAANSLMQQVNRCVSDNETESRHKRVAAIVRDAGAEGIVRSELLRRCQWLRQRELDETLNMLDQADIVVAEKGATGPKGGRPPIVYRAGKNS